MLALQKHSGAAFRWEEQDFCCPDIISYWRIRSFIWRILSFALQPCPVKRCIFSQLPTELELISSALKIHDMQRCPFLLHEVSVQSRLLPEESQNTQTWFKLRWKMLPSTHEFPRSEPIPWKSKTQKTVSCAVLMKPSLPVSRNPASQHAPPMRGKEKHCGWSVSFFLF